jgi:hypothetical protein
VLRQLLYFNECLWHYVCVPRKIPLPESEASICARLVIYRQRIKLPRRIFAQFSGNDPSVITRIELGRVPLKMDVALNIFRAFNINPCWLAEGTSPMSIGLNLAKIRESEIAKDALFSEVFASQWKKSLAHQVETIQSSPAYKYGGYYYPTGAEGRVMAEELLTSEVRCWIESVSNAQFNKLVNNIRFAALGIIEDRECRHETSGALKSRISQMNKVRERMIERRRYLTNVIVSDNNKDVKAQWPLLKARLQKSTTEKGSKSRLAEFLGLPLSSVSLWLSDSKSAREPGAETALRMLYWVEHRERK